MSKPWNKKPKRNAPLRGGCDVPGCTRRGGEMHECRTCLALAAAGKLEPSAVFKRKPCVVHRDKAIAEVKRHVLVAHPYNIVRWAAAALRGDT